MLDHEPHIKLSQNYFDYLARRFPVMCSSDEFHFLPRAQSAARHYDRLDDLDSKAVEEDIATLKGFQTDFAQLAARENNLENSIDLQLLQANIAGILIEFTKKRSWQNNPLLYLKIAFIGLDHALTKPCTGPDECIERVLSRLAGIPNLLKQATDNITQVPQTYHRASQNMLSDCKRYLHEIGKNLLQSSAGKRAEILSKGLENAAAALRTLDGFLAKMSPEPDHRFASETLETTLKDHFLTVRCVDDIYRMSLEDWEVNLNNLEKLRSKIDPASTWQKLYHSFFPSDIDVKDTISLYTGEMDRLRLFFSRRGFSLVDLSRPVEIAETPAYLRSVRGAASFAAAFTPDVREKSYFYITTHLPDFRTGEAANLLKKRFHREFKMLTAHETIPGHHFLDSIRRRLVNPIRRQIESPLFYEGWASYAEFLLIDSGYIDSPMEALVDYKRRLWRSARCQVDVGLTTGKINLENAIRLLKVCGFSSEEAHRQVDRFRLNPGYQLCYSLGSNEFKQLRVSCGRYMDETRFHTFLLEGGELPFHLIEKRLAASIRSNNLNES